MESNEKKVRSLTDHLNKAKGLEGLNFCTKGDKGLYVSRADINPYMYVYVLPVGTNWGVTGDFEYDDYPRNVPREKMVEICKRHGFHDYKDYCSKSIENIGLIGMEKKSINALKEIRDEMRSLDAALSEL